MTVAVEVEGLSLAYPRGDFRLDIARLGLAAGERAALVGPSGSGKTTLLHLLAGILVPDAGSIRIGGRRIAGAEGDEGGLDEAERRRWRLDAVGLVFQDLELLPYLTGLENVLLPLRLAGVRPGAAERDRARALAVDFGVEHTLGRRPARLSGGERQRLALARALIGRPSLLLLDEPTGSLDRANGTRAFERLWAAADELDATWVLVTHDEQLAARCPSRIDAGEGFAHRAPARRPPEPAR